MVREHASDLALLIHAAAQPSHDWAASDAQMDFSVNANGTMNLLEAVRHHKPDATFIFMSTNKVYGDHPNRLPLYETETRLELPADHEYHGGIDTTMSIDHCTHSLFGVSKVAADLMVQEYGKYFGMPTVCFRGGCLTGPSHAGAKLHGFLSYLMKCTVTGEPYTIFGYDGKQVRDNIHSADVVKAFDAFHRNPKAAAVYNLGGGRDSNVSMLEAIAMCQRIAGRPARLHPLRPGAHRRPPLVHLATSRTSSAITPSSSSSTASRPSSTRSTMSTSSSGQPRRRRSLQPRCASSCGATTTTLSRPASRR